MSQLYQKFDIALFDIPWVYEVWDEPTGGGRTASRHYKTQDPEYFYDLPVLDLMNDNALIFQWVTYPNLSQVFPLVEAWNLRARRKRDRFEYKTGFATWAKLNRRWLNTAKRLLREGVTDAALEEIMVKCFANGNGFYTMANCEPLLIFGRGNLSADLKRMTKAERHFQAHPVEEHSKKPDAFQEMINRVFPKARKLEVFARRELPGWTCMGNELSGNDIYVDFDAYMQRPTLLLP